jgi:hypothetical protein
MRTQEVVATETIVVTGCETVSGATEMTMRTRRSPSIPKAQNHLVAEVPAIVTRPVGGIVETAMTDQPTSWLPVTTNFTADFDLHLPKVPH